MGWFYTGPPCSCTFPVVGGFVPQQETVVLSSDTDIVDLSTLLIDSKYATLVIINTSILTVDIDYEVVSATKIHLLSGVVPTGSSFSFWKFDVVGGVTPIQEVVVTIAATDTINLITALSINSKLATIVTMNASILTVDREYEVAGPKQIIMKGGVIVPIGTTFNFIKFDS